MSADDVTADRTPEHVHDVSCAFGNPTCPTFGEKRDDGKPRHRRPRARWWHRCVAAMEDRR